MDLDGLLTENGKRGAVLLWSPVPKPEYLKYRKTSAATGDYNVVKRCNRYAGRKPKWKLRCLKLNLMGEVLEDDWNGTED